VVQIVSVSINIRLKDLVQMGDLLRFQPAQKVAQMPPSAPDGRGRITQAGEPLRKVGLQNFVVFQHGVPCVWVSY
jgi:hypothetical protein